MSIILFFFSFGSIFALIPIIIIIILIAAAGGSARGTDFFALFGIDTLLGISGRLGRGGAGRGISKSTAYKANKDKVKNAAGGKKVKIGGKLIENPGIGGLISGDPTKGEPFFGGALAKANAKSLAEQEIWKGDILKSLTDVQIANMAHYYGLGLAAGASKTALTELAMKNLSYMRIKSYVQKFVGRVPPGVVSPLSAPISEGRVNLAVQETYRKRYNKARRKGISVDKDKLKKMVIDIGDDKPEK